VPPDLGLGDDEGRCDAKNVFAGGTQDDSLFQHGRDDGRGRSVEFDPDPRLEGHVVRLVHAVAPLRKVEGWSSEALSSFPRLHKHRSRGDFAAVV